METRCIDITDWNVELLQPIVVGKREKYICYPNEDKTLSPLFYFKKPVQKYPWEFWSEVAASKIGQLLKFNIANYDVAYNNKGDMGCVSRSVFKPKEEFIHGQQFLLRLKPDFEVKEGGDHSFQLVEQFFLSYPKLKPLLKDFIAMLVFDAVVGNHDRHQQNWAITRRLDVPFFQNLVKQFFQLLNVNYSIEQKKNVEPNIHYGLSKIFDSGNCLGYNLVEEKLVSELLNDPKKFENFVNGNKSLGHLRWYNSRLKYVDLLIEIKRLYPDYVKTAVKQVRNNYKIKQVEKIINELDNEFPTDVIYSQYRLTLSRKAMFIKLLNRRFELLQPLLD